MKVLGAKFESCAPRCSGPGDGILFALLSVFEIAADVLTAKDECTHRCDIVRCDIVRCDIVHADTVEAA